MKTAEEYTKEIKEVLGFYSTYPNSIERQTICLKERIEAIQAEAMREAAEIVAIRNCHFLTIGLNLDYTNMKEVEKAILTRADQIEKGIK